MIGKAEIIRIAGQLNLNPHIVEKDYALGWLRAGIFANEKIADSWVFKGGTCLKKCFLETYRFSEDLDYQGSTRRIEPYSLRRTKDDNIILHAWNIDSDDHRSYRVDSIQGARTTHQVFTPRYAVELTPSGQIVIPPTEHSSSSSGGRC